MNKDALAHAIAFIRPWLELRYERDEIPGFVVAISQGGTVLMNEAYGYADLERKVPMTPGHVFRIASHSKTFTATALMLLAEEGKLRIDDRVVDYLPWIGQHADARWSEVTVRQLLAHIGGVIRDGLDTNYWQLDRPFPDAVRFRSDMLETGLVVDANTKMKYSNYGYTLLGMVIEAVSGQPYNEFVTERIVRPLGLRHTYPEFGPHITDPVVTGYSRRDNRIRLPIAPVDTRAMSPATGFCSTAEDLCTYFTAHMAGSGELLSDASKREMQRVQWHVKLPGRESHEDYGLGMILEEVDKRRVFGHSGGFPGCITKSMADAKDGLVVVALTNCVDGPASNIAQGIYKIIDYFQENTPAQAPAHDFTDLEGAYMNLWGSSFFAAVGDKMVAVDPGSWEPFASVESLEYVAEDTFRVTDTSSFGSEDELVRFHRRDGRVEYVSDTGSTLWPKKTWLARQAQRSVVEVR